MCASKMWMQMITKEVKDTQNLLYVPAAARSSLDADHNLLLFDLCFHPNLAIHILHSSTHFVPFAEEWWSN